MARQLRLPPVAVLGLKDTFSRPLRAALTVAGLILTVVVAIFAVGAQTSIEQLSRNTMYFQGTPAELRLDRGFLPTENVEAILAEQQEVSAYYGELNAYGWAAGSTEPVLVRALSKDYRGFDFGIVEGRMIESPDEAIVAYGLLDLAGLKVGDELRMVVDGHPFHVTIVGRYMEIANVGRVVMADLDTYHAQIDSDAEPQLYSLGIVPDTDVGALSDTLIRMSEGQFDIFVTDGAPNRSTLQVRDVVTSLGLLITIIAAVNLLTTTLLGVRERTRDFGIQKTLGCTPSQIGISIAVGACMLSLIGLTIGLPLGLVVYDGFLDVLGKEIGTGSEFGQMSGWLLVLLLPAMLLLAVLSSVVPARRATRLEVADALRHE
jgi:putative ABC transport system permease protein